MYVQVGAFQVRCNSYGLRDEMEIIKISQKKGWTPDIDLPLEEALPVAWPEKVPQKFHPTAMFKNAILIAAYYNRTHDDAALVLADRLYKRFLEFAAEQDGALYVVYNYPRSYRRVKVEAPWTSAYASGAVLLALTTMDKHLDLPGAKSSAQKILKGLASPIDTRNRPPLWVSFVDEDKFLWFEEMPLDQVEQPRILNGHIRALTGLYAHWKVYRDDLSEALLKAGITTIGRYAMQYRIPGGVNRYDLMGEPWPDYGPARTIDQQDQLFKMTGDETFSTYRDLFRSDMLPDAEDGDQA